MKMRTSILWILAFLLVAFAAIYQRLTGPTHPISGHVRIADDEISFSLPRSSGSAGDQEIRIPAADAKIGGFIELRRFPTADPWVRHDLERQGSDLVAHIPHQPPAGKVSYKIYLFGGPSPAWLTADPVILRFKGDVPAVIMIPHIILMFLAMWFSTRAGFEALLKRPRVLSMAVWTTITLGLGGLLLGPIVQKLAFGAYWTGWPFGTDLTDNKTVASFLLWVLAVWRLRRNPNARVWALLAAIVLFLIYMIPHSVLGSELDYSKTPTQNL